MTINDTIHAWAHGITKKHGGGEKNRRSASVSWSFEESAEPEIILNMRTLFSYKMPIAIAFEMNCGEEGRKHTFTLVAENSASVTTRRHCLIAEIYAANEKTLLPKVHPNGSINASVTLERLQQYIIRKMQNCVYECDSISRSRKYFESNYNRQVIVLENCMSFAEYLFHANQSLLADVNTTFYDAHQRLNNAVNVARDRYNRNNTPEKLAQKERAAQRRREAEAKKEAQEQEENIQKFFSNQHFNMFRLKETYYKLLQEASSKELVMRSSKHVSIPWNHAYKVLMCIHAMIVSNNTSRPMRVTLSTADQTQWSGIITKDTLQFGCHVSHFPTIARCLVELAKNPLYPRVRTDELDKFVQYAQQSLCSESEAQQELQTQ